MTVEKQASGECPSESENSACREAGTRELSTGGDATWAWLPIGSLVAAVIFVAAAASLSTLTQQEAPDPLLRPLIGDGQILTRDRRLLSKQILTEISPATFAPAPVPEAKTCSIQIKGGWAATATNRVFDCGVQSVPYVHAFEVLIRTQIESNDGSRVVEVRRFERVWEVTLFALGTQMTLQLGPIGQDLLGVLKSQELHVGTRRIAPSSVAAALLPPGQRQQIREATARAFWKVDPLSGKAVRITYAAGRGVESIQPLGCDLGEEEACFLFALPLLSEATWPSMKPAECRLADASFLRALMPPFMRTLPSGEVAIVRQPEPCENGANCFRIDGGDESVDYPITRAFWGLQGVLQKQGPGERVTQAELCWNCRHGFEMMLSPAYDYRFLDLARGTIARGSLVYCCSVLPLAG